MIKMIGQKFGKLTVIGLAPKHKGRLAYKCQCTCGNIKNILGENLRNGDTKSCGCLVKKHGMSRTREYVSWRAMNQRCANKTMRNYHYYGGRGIKVCDRWLKSFINFFEDMGKRPENLTLDRKDNNKGYYKENCRWATRTEQVRNRGLFKKNTLGTTGIKKQGNKYCPFIIVSRKYIHLGSFVKIQDAIEARQKAKGKYWDRGVTAA